MNQKIFRVKKQNATCQNFKTANTLFQNMTLKLKFSLEPMVSKQNKNTIHTRKAYTTSLKAWEKQSKVSKTKSSLQIPTNLPKYCKKCIQ